MQEIENKVISIVGKLEHQIDSSDTYELLNLVTKHGEYGIALENLCSILEERSILISTEMLDEIIELFCQMGFSSDVLAHYRKHLLTHES